MRVQVGLEGWRVGVGAMGSEFVEVVRMAGVELGVVKWLDGVGGR